MINDGLELAQVLYFSFCGLFAIHLFNDIWSYFKKRHLEVRNLRVYFDILVFCDIDDRSYFVLWKFKGLQSLLFFTLKIIKQWVSTIFNLFLIGREEYLVNQLNVNV